MKKIIKEIQDKNILVSDLLRRAKVIATKLNQEDTIKWINLELDGYGEGDDIPSYRKLSGKVKFYNPYYGWQPVIFSNSEHEEKISNRFIKQGVGQIEELLNNKTQEYSISYPASVAKEILLGSPFQTDVSLFIDRSSLVGELDKVRNLLLDWAVGLESKGIETEGEEFSSEQKREAQIIQPKYQIGVIEQLHGNIGEFNEQKEGGEVMIPKQSLLSKFFWYVLVAFLVVVSGNICSAIILKFLNISEGN